MDGTLEDRLAALERAVTDGEHDCSALAEGAATADRVTEIEAELGELTDRVAELEAATQALRGYVGNVRSVNADVEERADLALSKAEAARRAIDQLPGAGETEASQTASGQREQGTHERNSPDQRATELAGGEGCERDRCARCERPFADGHRDSAGTVGPGTERTGSDSDPSGLDALREPTDARSEELRAMAGTEPDGGRPEPTTGRNGTGTAEESEQAATASVISRVRSLL